MPARLLFVDDDPAVLEAITANLRRSFEILTAVSAAAGIEVLQANPGIAVVVSDMRMPVTNGAAFLAQVRTLAPTTVRVLLTGHSDLDSAIAAVNEVGLFRFLVKPCRRDELRAAIDAAIAQHELLVAERELLEQTLRGSVKMLIDILALTKPVAFGRAHRIKARVLELARELGFDEMWPFEIAAMASQLGYITLPQTVYDKLEHGAPLNDHERQLVARAPEAASSLLAHIPRLEIVREILEQHVRPLPRNRKAKGRLRRVEVGAHLLRIALDLDDLGETDDCVGELKSRGAYDTEILEALSRIEDDRRARRQIVDVAPHALRPGMVLAEDIRLATGALLVARGYELTPSFIERVRNFPAGTLKGSIRVGT